MSTPGFMRHAVAALVSAGLGFSVSPLFPDAAIAAIVIDEPSPPANAPAPRPESPPRSRPHPQAPAPPRTAGIPTLSGPVVDDAGILDSDDRRVLESLAWDIKQSTGAEIAVLTVRTTAPLDEFTYGMKVVSAWKLGSAEKDDGLLFLVSVDDHRARFFTGYGLEGVLPDGRLGAILDHDVIPHFRSGDYPGGIRAGMTEVARILKTEYGGSGAPPPRSGAHGPAALWGILVVVLLWFVIARMMLGSRQPRRFFPIYWGGGGFGGGFGGGGGGFGGGGFGGGGGGFGGGGGGFGGGGGGFGGGGAGRSW